MATTSVPGWCCVRWGRSDVVLIAPHGGRRPPGDLAAPRERKVNDLHTAQLTAELAAALDASAIINDACDRNQVDLNRISQVRQHAPWFLDLMVDAIARVLARHPQAQIFIVHGWNVGQPKCDLGVGGVEDQAGLRSIANATLSVAPEYWASRVAHFRSVCGQSGIATPVGERYPAAHRNNLLQLLTPRFGDATDHRIHQLAAWAAAGQINALQLELGIPLRWPGPLRAALQTAAVRAFGEPSWRTYRYAPPTPRRAPSNGMLGFHFHDPGCDLTLFTSITPTGSVTSGRLLLFLGGQEIALFTGEEPDLRGTVGGLEYEAIGDGFALRFHGHASRLADAGLYLDLEAALAASVLASVRLDLRYEPLVEAPAAQPQAGRFSGTLRIDGRDVAITARGFFDPAVALRGPGSHAARTHLAAMFDDRTALSVRIADGDAVLKGPVMYRGQIQLHPHGQLAVAHDGDEYTPRQFRLRLAGASEPVVAHPLARMPILRPLSDGAHARITFGPARFEWDGRLGWGVYEYARRVTPRGSSA